MSALQPRLAPVQAPHTPGFVYERRRPELTDLHAAVRIGWPLLREAVQNDTGTALPLFVRKGFGGYLTCGQLPKGFARFRCGACRKDILVAFSCKVRGLCPSCDGKRMVEEAEHMTGAILPDVPYRQWVLTLPYALRYLLAWNAKLRSVVHQALMRAIVKHYQRDAALQQRGGGCVIAAISVAQRFSSDLKLNLHWHILLADGVWQERDGHVQFYPAEPLDTIRVQETLHDAVLRITKALTRRGWQDREDDPFTEQEPGLSALWRAALLGKPIDPATEQPKRAGGKQLPIPNGRNCARQCWLAHLRCDAALTCTRIPE